MPEFELVITSVVCLFLLLALLFDSMPVHILMFAALSVLVLAGVLTPEQAFAGFSNNQMLTIALLYVVAASFNACGLTGYLGHITMGTSQNPRRALVRMMIISVLISIFLNNTPIVAILAPAVVEWCSKNSVPPSKMLIPLSYAVIFGGLCSLIGTSTNLIVSGLMEQSKMYSLSFFEIGYIGIPTAIIGIIYTLTIGWRLLPSRKIPIDEVCSQDCVLFVGDKAKGLTNEPSIIPTWKKNAPFVILGGMVISVVAGYASMFQAAVAGVFVTLIFGIVKPSAVFDHIEWKVLIVIACSFGIASAIESSGIANGMANLVVAHIGNYGFMVGLLAILVATCIITEFLANNATAVLMFPIAMAIAQQFGADPRGFAIAVAIGSSAGFAVPFGYQTHFMVYGLGGYRFRDFLIVGIPLDILYIIAGTLIIPLIWKL